MEFKGRRRGEWQKVRFEEGEAEEREREMVGIGIDE